MDGVKNFLPTSPKILGLELLLKMGSGRDDISLSELLDWVSFKISSKRMLDLADRAVCCLTSVSRLGAVWLAIICSNILGIFDLVDKTSRSIDACSVPSFEFYQAARQPAGSPAKPSAAGAAFEHLN